MSSGIIMIIHLIRHTTPDIEKGICYGSADINLANSFEIERNVILSKLKDNYDAVFTSPLSRCKKLSKFIHSETHSIDDRIKEYDFGDWELKPWSEINDEKAQYWMDNYISSPAPNGDSLISMKNRVDDFWQEITQLNLSRIAIVTHAGVIRLIHGLILETPLTHLFRLQLNYGAVIEIQLEKDTAFETLKHL